MNAAAAAVLAVVALACGGHPEPAQAPGPPAPVEASCVLGADGATCTFKNGGRQAGARCFKILYGNPDTAAVISSDEVCSPRLAAGAVAAVAVRFPRRPGDTCGAGVARCTVRVADPAAAEAVAAAWQDELKSPGTGPLTEAECRQGGARIFQVAVDEEKRRADSPEDQKRVEEAMQGMRDRVIEEFTRECRQRLTRAQFDCYLKAKGSDDLMKCEHP